MENNKTVIGKVIAAVLSIFIENWQTFIVKLWKKIPGELQTELLKIVGIVNNIKDYIDSPVVDLITFAIPGPEDDAFVKEARLILDVVMREVNKDVKNFTSADLHTIGTRLTQELTGMTFGQAAISIENAYQNSK